MQAPLDYSWPGNTRPPEHVTARALVLTADRKISIDDLPEAVRRPAPEGASMTMDGDDLSVKRHGARLERHLIERALDRTAGNKTQAAELLELSPRALRYKIQEYGIG
jgi:two-component system response regulator AtoC